MSGIINKVKAVEILLSREAAMASMSVGNGLSQIRRYNYSATGYFYNGLHSIATGIERILKLVLIYDYKLMNNDDFPDNTLLKTKGHKISDLIRNTQEIIVHHNIKVDESILSDEIIKRIIIFITDFALQARYYNLDYLTGKSQDNFEPLERWDYEICDLIISRHYKRNSRKEKQADELAKLVEPFMLVRHTDEKGNDISSVKSMLEMSKYIDIKQKYSMYYFYLIIKYTADILRELEWKGNFFPCLREFFAIFNNDNKQFILSRKTWNLYKP